MRTSSFVKSKPTARIMTIRPARARKMLACAMPGKRLSDRRLNLFSIAMHGHQWALNGSSICFDEAGTLIDGVHRLTACVRSKTPFQTVVVMGLPLPCKQPSRHEVWMNLIVSAVNAALSQGILIPGATTDHANAWFSFPVSDEQTAEAVIHDQGGDDLRVKVIVPRDVSKVDEQDMARREHWLQEALSGWRMSRPMRNVVDAAATGWLMREKDGFLIAGHRALFCDPEVLPELSRPVAPDPLCRVAEQILHAPIVPVL